jgi:integrase
MAIAKRINHGEERWVFDYRDHHGKRHMRFYKTKREAEDAQTEIKKQIKDRTYVDPAELPTFAVVARQWLDSRRDRAPQTWEMYRIQIERHLIPAFGNHRIDQIRPEHVETWKQAAWKRSPESAGTLSRTTVNNILQQLRAVLNYAMGLELIRFNPADKSRVSGIRKQRKAKQASVDAIPKEKVLTVEQAAAAIAKADDGLHRTFIKTALMTGCRVGELQALQWEGLDLEAGTLDVHQALAREPGEKQANGRAKYGSSKALIGPPKSDASYRTVTLPGDLVRDLKAWFLRTRFKGPTDFVFPNSLGGPLHRSYLSKGLHAALDRAGVPRITVHGCRHSYASWLLMQGRPVTQVAALLGHGDPQITLKRYAHWYKGENNRDAVEGLADAFRQASDGKRMVSGGD